MFTKERGAAAVAATGARADPSAATYFDGNGFVLSFHNSYIVANQSDFDALHK